MKTLNLISALTFSAICSLLNVSIAQDSQLNINGHLKNSNCFGANDGEIDLVIEGGQPPYMITWSNGSSEEDQKNLFGGKYSVTVSDASGNEMSKEFVLRRPRPLSIMLSINDVSNSLATDGSIEANVSGGLTPYTYEWNDGNKGTKLENLGVGEYSLTVKDNKGCSLAIETNVKSQDLPMFDQMNLVSENIIVEQD